MPTKSRSFWEWAGLISSHILLSMAIFSAVIAILVFTFRKSLRKYKPVDLAVFRRLDKWTNPINTRLMLFFTFLGNHVFLIPANLLLLFYFLLVHHQNGFALRVIVISLSSLVLMFLLKSLFGRKRPLAPLIKAVRGLSFPSGHAIMSIAYFGLIIYILWHSDIPGWVKIILSAFLILIILIIGFSRIYLRVHYASDVLSGFIIGFLWLLISLKAMNLVSQISYGGKTASTTIRATIPPARSLQLRFQKKSTFWVKE